MRAEGGGGGGGGGSAPLMKYRLEAGDLRRSRPLVVDSEVTDLAAEGEETVDWDSWVDGREAAVDALRAARASESSINFRWVVIGDCGEDPSPNPAPLIIDV